MTATKTRKEQNGKLNVKVIKENGIDKMVQISTLDSKGVFTVITVGFSQLSGLFNVNVQPSEQLSLCRGTMIVGDGYKVLYTEPEKD